MTKPLSSLTVAIDNLPQIAAAYSDGIAARVLLEVWKRLSAAFGEASWGVCEKSWGVTLNFYGTDASSFGYDFIEVAVAAACRRPVTIGAHEIVVSLSVSSGEPAPTDLAHTMDTARYRVDMCAASLAYSALESGRMHFAKQPVTAADAGAEPLYHECLVRLIGDDGAVILPGAYLGALERLGLMRAFDRYVVREIVRQLRSCPGAVLGCNISGLSAVHDIWWGSVLADLNQSPDVAKRLVIEITETAALPNVADAIEFIAAMRRTGVRIALDDFGAGHSSDAFARQARVDIIKIDGSYVRLRMADADGQPLLHRLVSRLHSFGPTIVVEGIEGADDLRLAVESGALWFQGYYFGHPELPRYEMDKIISSDDAGRLH